LNVSKGFNTNTRGMNKQNAVNARAAKHGASVGHSDGKPDVQSFQAVQAVS